MRILMLLLIATIATFGINACAADKPVLNQEHQVICYNDALTKEEIKLGMKPPCAPDNYIYTPLNAVQKNATHDADGIWPDADIDGRHGSWIWSWTTHTTSSAEIKMSMLSGGACGSPSLCPVRVLVRQAGKKDVLLGWPKIDMTCASGKYYFLRKDMKSLIACGKEVALNEAFVVNH